MPELPEVETIRLQLSSLLKNLTIKNIRILAKKSFIGPKRLILGTKITKVERKAKMLIFHLNNGLALLTHLKMTGQLLYEGKAKSVKRKKSNTRLNLVSGLPNKYTRVVVTFKNGDRLFFNDMRRFGWMKILSQKSPKQSPEGEQVPYRAGKLATGQAPVKSQKYSPRLGEAGNSKFKIEDINNFLGKLGSDPMKELTQEEFREILRLSRRSIKLVLMDQEKIAGVGNIYANEALFCAGIDPKKKAIKLSSYRAIELLKCLKKVLTAAIRWKGASRQHFRDIFGQKGQVQEHFLVYDREGKECPNKCGRKIKKVKLGGRGTFFCPKCQR